MWTFPNSVLLRGERTIIVDPGMPLRRMSPSWAPWRRGYHYEGLGKGSSHFAQCLPPASSAAPTRLPLESSTGYRSRSAWMVVA